MDKDMLTLEREAARLGIRLGPEQLDLFDLYHKELRLWNARTNLISENTTEEIVSRHFLDSLTAVPYVTPPDARLIDIGCGAGFPGLPLKIALPSLRLTLLEVNRKKVSFLKHIIRLLRLDDTDVLHDRAENIVRSDRGRGTFAVAVSRASLKLSELLPLCDFFLPPGGLLITFKGPSAAAELAPVVNDKIISKKYQFYQYDVNDIRPGPARKIIIAEKAK